MTIDGNDADETETDERVGERTGRLARELDDAFRARADLYRVLLEELDREVGPKRAEALFVRALRRRGREVAAKAFAGFGPRDALALGDAFLAASPDGGRLYPTRVDRRDDGIVFAVARCPLKDAWRAAGVDDAALARLCRIAGAFDHGLFTASGVRFANRTWEPGRDGCCTIELADA
jgi:hypothetical protein